MKTLKFETQYGTCEIVPNVTEAISLSSNGKSGKTRKVFSWLVYLNGEPKTNWLYNLPKDQYKIFQDWMYENEQALKEESKGV
jgi:hypothetical protein